MEEDCAFARLQSPTVGKPEFTGVGTLIVREAGCAPSRKMSANRSHKDEPGRYTHRVAISNHRLVSLADGQVTFRWRDSAHNNEQKLMTLSIDEFLRRFLLHLLPKCFVRIRHFGFLANRRRSILFVRADV